MRPRKCPRKVATGGVALDHAPPRFSKPTHILFVSSRARSYYSGLLGWVLVEVDRAGMAERNLI